MKNKSINYLSLIGMHVGIALLIFILPFFAKVYLLLIFIIGFLYVVKKQNKNNEVLMVSGYIVGAEVLLRATDAAILYEFSKYGIILFIIVGIYYSSFSKNALPYFIYILLLIPSVIIATYVLNATTEERKIISFTLSGPLCLGILSIYTFQRKMLLETLNTILLATALPIVSLTTYLILFNPSVRDVVTGTDSNFDTSGGFGPNQVATVLGLGMFIFMSRVILKSHNKFLILFNFAIVAVITFRGLVTFSRGGILTSIIMIIVLLINVYFLTDYKSKFKLNLLIFFTIIASLGIWGYSVLQTNGLLVNRYENKDAAGRVKESRLSGREDLINSELELFFENPIFGVGVGKSVEIRNSETGIKTASHNEITRLLAEHGTLGIVILIILFLTPVFIYFNNKQNIFMFSFFLFWLLTINHAAMRIAAPAFIYALSLLKIYIKIPETNSQKSDLEYL